MNFCGKFSLSRNRPTGRGRENCACDPTGCGDAFRAGLLYGIARGLDWRACGQIASLMGGIKVEHHGTQNHRFTHPEFEARYHKNFATKIRLGD